MMKSYEDRLRAQMRGVVMPPKILELGGGDLEELSEYATSVASLVAVCMLNNKMMSSTELAIVAYEYGWTRRQKEMAADVLRLNGVWKENKHEKEND